MKDIPTYPRRPPSLRDRFDRRIFDLLANQGLQNRIARLPILKRFARRDGEAVFDIMMGFINSQVLMALVRLRIFDHLSKQSAEIDELAHHCDAPADRIEILCRAGVALGLLHMRKSRVRLSRKGAVFAAVPGLSQLVDHHDILYQDLSKPQEFFRGRTDPALAQFWPYVFTQGTDLSPQDAQRYSQLMTDTQNLVAHDTLHGLDIGGAQSWLDVGGGSGAFIGHVAAKFPDLTRAVFDIVPSLSANESFERHVGSFKTDALPLGNDVISVIRVLYDHSDATIQNLLGKIYTALPSGGQIVISEPMLGTPSPSRAGDVYFAIYTLAMKTGKTRNPNQIIEIMNKIGFSDIHFRAGNRPFVTSVITAHKK